MNNIPTEGRIVLYKLNQSDVDFIRARRTRTGTSGNEVTAGDMFPAVVVHNWGGSHEGAAVNLKVFLDGDDCFWATSRHLGEHEGDFQWPVRT